MTLIFFIRSSSVNISNYSIKDLPGSTGRLDVISRCILAALLNNDSFERDVQIWVFLDNYGTFIFNTNLLDYITFPKNELLLTDHFVDLIQKKESRKSNPLSSVEILKKDILDSLIQFQKLEYSIFILKEDGDDFFNHLQEISQKKKLLFVVGSQSGDFINSGELFSLNFPTICLGTQSYLASSVIRLLKLYVLK